MIEKSTDELDQLLRKTNIADMDKFHSDNKNYFINAEKEFYYYMKDTLDLHHVLLKDVYTFANVTEKYGSKILRMEEHTKNRDLILLFCIGGHFTLEETNRALKLYNMPALYSRNQRDQRIILAILHKIKSLSDIDDMLTSAGYEKLSRELKETK